jgi:predicted metal-dependent phosphoesterase TrpH
MEKLCDLHTHSNFSDGTLSPGELLKAAQTAGLSAVALCDHNTVAGLPDFLAAAAASPVEAVPGIEISADYQDGEVHILGIFLQPRHYSAVAQKMAQVQQRKEESNRKLIEALRAAGVVLDYDEIKAANPDGFINRANIAAALVAKGYAADRKDAFKRYLKPSAGFYRPPKRIDAEESVRFLKSLGAVVILAHPFLNLDEAGLRGFLELAVTWGLDGMETEYPLFDEQQREKARFLAGQFGLLPSGGSDFHGANKPDIRLGTGKGDLRVPLAMLTELRKKAKPQEL